LVSRKNRIILVDNLYLSIVLDLFSRQIVGWAMSNRINRKLVVDSLLMGTWHRNPGPGLIFHTDRGSQYCSNAFQKALKSYKMFSSMSRTGDCWDNAVAESFFASLKTDRVFFNTYKKREEAQEDILDYIEIFITTKGVILIWEISAQKDMKNCGK
jgi:transposase InsO family protein